MLVLKVFVPLVNLAAAQEDGVTLLSCLLHSRTVDVDVHRNVLRSTSDFRDVCEKVARGDFV